MKQLHFPFFSASLMLGREELDFTVMVLVDVLFVHVVL